MRRRKQMKPLSSDSSSDDDEPLSKKLNRSNSSKTQPESSSSESDIENYLQPFTLNLDQPFFNTCKPTDSVIKTDKSINENLSDSSDLNETEAQDTTQANEIAKLNFQKLHDFTKQLEDAKKQVEQYNAKKHAQTSQMDILNLLAAGESHLSSGRSVQMAEIQATLHSSDFDSTSDSEKEGWVEVATVAKNKEKEQTNDIQITVNMPGIVKKKKKQNDLLAAIKRRFNRIKKENQVGMHKVHLLAWIAHGNYVTGMINNLDVLAAAMSLLPSQQCYPAERTDLNYLEQVLKWYKNTVVIIEKPVPKNLTLDQLLQMQIQKKQVYNYKMLVFVFVAILRSLGIQCRVVFSFQVVPLRPPSNELYSLSNKNEEDQKKEEKVESILKSAPKKVGDSIATTSGINSKKVVVAKTSVGAKTKASNVVAAKPSATVSKKSGTVKMTDKGKTNASSAVVSKAKPPVKETKKKGADAGKMETRPKPAAVTAKTKATVPVKPIAKPSGSGSKDAAIKTKAATLKASESGNKETVAAGIKTKAAPIKASRGKKTIAAKIADLEPSGAKSKSTNSEKQVPTIKIQAAKDKKKAKTETAAKPRAKSTSNSKSNLKVTPETKPRSKSKDEPKRRLRSSTIPQVDGAHSSDSEPDLPTPTTRPNLRKRPKPHLSRLTTKPVKVKDTDSEDDFTDNISPPKLSRLSQASTSKSKSGAQSKFFDVRNDVKNLVKDRIKEQKQLSKNKLDSDDDSDYAPEAIQKKEHSDDDFSPKIKVKQRVQTKSSRKVLSSDSDAATSKRKGIDVWAEVFLEAEEKWISVDVVKGTVHCVKEIHTRATTPVAYIVAWNNNNTLKDITKRYCQNFNTVTRKLRVEAKWWAESLKPFEGASTVRDKEENDELEREQMEKPLPTSISEYKNHPLYALQRHLLKFEAIYPADSPPLGFIRKEPVFSRQCVYTCHSRDIWVKHAKVVKAGEKPYKIVKARPKYDKLSNSMITAQNLEIFGPWQTQEYEPPTAENGVVPRNAFGNVELFKMCMLPKKTVHLRLPGLNKIARRMNIDCASAIVGFDFHGGYSHPTYDGFVVCEEFEDILIAGWDVEQEEIEKRDVEKKEKRIYGNWKKLIKGLLIRRRLKARYEFGEPKPEDEAGTSKSKGKAPKFATKKKEK